MATDAHTLQRETSSETGKGPTLSADSSALVHATRLVHRVCCLAGSADFIDEVRTENRALCVAIKGHDTPALFDWLMAALSHQGVSDRVSSGYMDRHGRASWHETESALGNEPSCPKLSSYWNFHRCGYHKTTRTCSEPDHIDYCPLPTHNLRNGRLNQTAYSLYLFIRDIAGDDLVRWIRGQLASAADTTDVSEARNALLDPLRNVYGVSDKVLSMALSTLLIAAPRTMSHWAEVGYAMIAIDTLVHNFLFRTGILHRFDADHLYGVACYRDGGCVDIVQIVAEQIDARQFNPRFPKTFPRFVQHAIWRYCAENGLDVCNGNRINDDNRCNNVYCRVRKICDRVPLRSNASTKVRTVAEPIG
jgi:hypothetical protein